MESSELALQHAAESLLAHVDRFPWFVGLGVGQVNDEDALILYVTSQAHREIASLTQEWEGIPLAIVPTGKVRPAEETEYAW